MWQFILADLNGAVLADISDVRQRRVSMRLNRPSTLSFVMDLTHRAVADLLNQQHCFVYAYRDGVLRLVTETSTLETVGSGDSHSIAVNCIEAAWIRLAKRYIGQSAEGVLFGPSDRRVVVQSVLADANALSSTGVNWGGDTITTETVTAGTWYFKPVMEAITELSSALNGFDFWFDQVLPSAANVYRVGTLRLDNVRGDLKPNAVFEYGYGQHNAREYRWLSDLQHRITHAISLPPTYPNNLGLPVAHSYDTTTETTWPGLKRREDIIQNDLVQLTLRQKLIDEHILVRKNPRNIYEIQPHIADDTGRVPTPFTDYGVGDTVEGRVKDSGVLLLDGLLRVYGLDFSMEDSGLEEVTLTVVDD